MLPGYENWAVLGSPDSRAVPVHDFAAAWDQLIAQVDERRNARISTPETESPVSIRGSSDTWNSITATIRQRRSLAEQASPR